MLSDPVKDNVLVGVSDRELVNVSSFVSDSDVLLVGESECEGV